MKARKLAGVPYPNMYASQEEAAKDLQKLKFNCTQRSHQNMLEKYPMFLMLLAIGSKTSPLYAGIAGVLYLIGRVDYAIGYSTGDAKKRNSPISALQYVGLLTLLVLSFKTSYSYF